MCIVHYKHIEDIHPLYVYKLLEFWRPDIKWAPEDSQGYDALHECNLNHKLVYFEGMECPVCKILAGFNELRSMYFDEYSKNSDNI